MNSGAAFVPATGRYTVKDAKGVYYCYAQIRFDNAARSYMFRLVVAVKGDKDTYNGMHAIDGDGGSNNYRSMVVAGTLLLNTNDYVSVFMYTNGDNSWIVNDESGFGCHYLSTKIGFHASVSARMEILSTGWHTVTNWRTSGNTELYVIGGATMSPTAFTAPKPGYYVCASQVQVDSMSRSYYVRLVVAVNNNRDYNNGLHSMHGNRGSTNYRSLRVAGTVYLAQADSVSVFVYTNGDNNWRVETGSGFSCHMLPTYQCTKCPKNSVGTSVEAGCKCAEGKTGEIKPLGQGKYIGACISQEMGCAVNTGFLAYLDKDNDFGREWNEVTQWNSAEKTQAIYNAGGRFNDGNGRFAPLKDGYYLCSANIQMQDHSYSYYTRLVLAINGDHDVQNGQSVIEGDGGSTDYRTMTVSGTMHLSKTDYVSVWVYSNGDNSWKTNKDSGFSCHKFSTSVGFHADKVGSRTIGTNWNTVDKYRTSGAAPLYNSGGGFDSSSGKFTSPLAGVYYCYANLRFDSGSRSYYFRLSLQLNGVENANYNGLTAREGNNGSNNYRSLVVFGTLNLPLMSYVNVGVYSNGDNSWTIHDETGFGCHLMNSKIGFHADYKKDSQNYPKGWHQIKDWGTTQSDALYGNVPSDGFYNVAKSGYYVCYANLRLDNLHASGYNQAVISVNSDVGIHALRHRSGNREATNYRSTRISGTVYLKKGDKVGVHVYSATDNSWQIQSESGFGCQEFKSHTCEPCPTNSKGENLSKGCKCNSGYSGSIAMLQGKNGGFSGRCILSNLKCGQNFGFSADKRISQTSYMDWNEITYWSEPNAVSLYNTGESTRGILSFNAESGHFTAIKAGYFLCSANIRLDSLTYSGLSKIMLAINGNIDTQNGLVVSEGDGGSTNYRTMSISGTIKLKKAQYVSAWVYTNADNSYTIHEESGFSCHMLKSDKGFHADKDGDQSRGRLWQQISGWRTSGADGLYINPAANIEAAYSIPVTGVYYCYANIRIDSGGRGYEFRLLIGLDDDTDYNNGLHSMEGNMGSNNYRNMNAAGTVQVDELQNIAVYIYTNGDNSWKLQTESGFGCHFLSSGIGFHADMSASMTFGIGWSTVSNWDTSSGATLYATGGGASKTGFQVPQDGYYICSAQMRFDSASGAYMSMAIVTNGVRNRNNGLYAISGSRDSTSKRDLTVAGTVKLKKDDTMAVHVYSNQDNSWTVHHESGI